MLSRLTVLALLACLASGAALAQTPGFGLFNNRNHPELDWQVAETEHFEIMYPARLAGIEEQAAAVAEETYAALQTNIGPVDFPDRIRVYLSDEDEIANGIAYESSRVGVTAIWVHINEFANIWTGDVKWLRKVMAHEIAHIFHFRKTRSNIGVAQNLLADALPSFWAEGFAQYMTERWDAARGDAVLRQAVFEDRLSYSDGLSPTNGRLRYAVGNSQIRYLAQTRGDSVITKLLEHRDPALFGVAKVHDFYSAFRATVGKAYPDFYEEWRKHVNVYYNTIAGQMERQDSLNVKPLAVPGQAIRQLQFNPDTSRYAAVVLASLARPITRLISAQQSWRGHNLQRQRPASVGRRLHRRPHLVEPGRRAHRVHADGARPLRLVRQRPVRRRRLDGQAPEADPRPPRDLALVGARRTAPRLRGRGRPDGQRVHPRHGLWRGDAADALHGRRADHVRAVEPRRLARGLRALRHRRQPRPRDRRRGLWRGHGLAHRHADAARRARRPRPGLERRGRCPRVYQPARPHR